MVLKLIMLVVAEKSTHLVNTGLQAPLSGEISKERPRWYLTEFGFMLRMNMKMLHQHVEKEV